MNRETREFIWGLLLLIAGTVAVLSGIYGIDSNENWWVAIYCVTLAIGLSWIYNGYSHIRKTI